MVGAPSAGARWLAGILFAVMVAAILCQAWLGYDVLPIVGVVPVYAVLLLAISLAVVVVAGVRWLLERVGLFEPIAATFQFFGKTTGWMPREWHAAKAQFALLFGDWFEMNH